MKILEHVNIYELPNPSANEAICVTTNGIVKQNGEAVMGAGIAKTANNFLQTNGGQSLSKQLGNYIKIHGNHVFDFGVCQFGYRVIAFPTKNAWWKNSDLNLINQSISELIDLCDKQNITKCYLPKPGCANGGLSWETQVKPLCESRLDDRFTVVSL